MFCSNCGKEIQEGWATCPQCGNSLKKKIKEETSSLPSPVHIEKNKKKSKVLGIAIGIALVLIIGAIVVGSDDSETKGSSVAEQEVLDKLQTFTTIYQDEDKYYFLNEKEDWVLTYTTENQFVSFENDTVISCYSDAFGAGCFSEGAVSDLGFSYDLSDDDARVYFDVEIEDGHLSIISYNLENQEYELMIDGDKWSASDEFCDFVQKYGLAQSIEADVAEFKRILQDNGLTVDDLLGVKFDTIDSQFVPESETTNEKEDSNKTTTDEVTDTESVDTESVDTEAVDTEEAESTSLAWKEAYLNYLNENGNTDYGYSLSYIDEDDIPELVIDTMITASGVELCTFDGENIISTSVGESLMYRQGENLFCVSGGRMDYYYDTVYKIVDGIPVEVSRGEWGNLDYENIKYDEAGDFIYQYSIDGESVSAYDYYALTEPFSYEDSSAYPAGRGYLYDVIEVLSHPLDITIIDPYMNPNGYMNLLSDYVILFDGLDDEKIHFTVTHNGELIGSASATITSARTAEYKNANSELIITFDKNYEVLKIEGYMGNVDLTGDYGGIWG